MRKDRRKPEWKQNQGSALSSDYLVDIDRWISMFPLQEELRRLSWPYRLDCNICGPGDLAIVEQLRREARRADALGATVPNDIFVFAHGEPNRRDVTKIGGLPYRPADLPWPKTPKSGDMTFLAQYRFGDSKDIVGKLPGDILLVFCRDRQLGDKDWTYFHFEWYSLGLRDLIASERVPAPAWEFITCFGLKCRSVDYLEKDRLAERILPLLPVIESSVRLSGEPNWSAVDQICRLDGTKIGGLPTWLPSEEMPDKARFLCSLGNFTPKVDSPYPWANWATPIRLFDFDLVTSDQVLYWFDGCAIYFFISDDGKIEWRLKLV
jgi:hypothetical protein